MTILCLVRGPVLAPDLSLQEVPVRAERRDVAKRIWRTTAEDGTPFGFELEKPFKHGDTVLQAAEVRYVIRQIPEPVLCVSLDMAGSAAAGLGWAFGNLHLEASTEPGRLIVADSPVARRLLEKLGLPFVADLLVFRPGHFARGPLPAHEFGPSHQH
jgi:urease accessory protein